MKLIRLTPEYEFNDFDCGDDDLNEFLYEDAKKFLENYMKNGFNQLTQKEEDNHTRLMFFDMMEIE